MCITLKWQIKGHCIDCGKRHYGDNIAWRCTECRDTVANYRTAFRKYLLSALKTGILKPVKTLFCVDCGAQAEHWDHRDYNRIEDVVPVCRTCNFQRGPAVWSNYRQDNSMTALEATHA